MGQFAKNWNQLKTLIRQKDDTIAALQKQIAVQTPLVLDADDQKALAELQQIVSPVPAQPPALSNAASPAHPPGTPVTTFTK